MPALASASTCRFSDPLESAAAGSPASLHRNDPTLEPDTITMSGKDFSGTWRLVPEKSDIPPVTKSQLLTIETDGVHVTMRETLVNDRDETLSITWDGEFDGVDTPVHGTSFADTVAYTQPDPRTIEGIAKKDGRVVVKETAELDEGGDGVNITYVSFDADGVSSIRHGFFERVDEREAGRAVE